MVRRGIGMISLIVINGGARIMLDIAFIVLAIIILLAIGAVIYTLIKAGDEDGDV